MNVKMNTDKKRFWDDLSGPLLKGIWNCANRQEEEGLFRRCGLPEHTRCSCMVAARYAKSDNPTIVAVREDPKYLACWEWDGENYDDYE